MNTFEATHWPLDNHPRGLFKPFPAVFKAKPSKKIPKKRGGQNGVERRIEHCRGSRTAFRAVQAKPKTQAGDAKMTKEKESDIYIEEALDNFEEDDILSGSEVGFMKGYLAA